MKGKLVVIVAMLSIASANGFAVATEKTPNLKEVAPYPPAEKGQVRHVILLPAVDNEDNFQVELAMGKTMTVDCNSYTMGGHLETNTIQGWGYDYFVLTRVSQLASTMMACTDNSQRDAFVAIQNANRFERYNSKLPIVVYTPKDVEVRYRIWTAGDTFRSAEVK
ncbi:serine protease inhibitor ecotin [Aeromonas sp. MdU4]|uniref:serine protease inhibitor ecotin n=1 Tax=Aeromonas sp. MdU4 TaxID=3342819 RepID=UPI0035BAE4F2